MKMDEWIVDIKKSIEKIEKVDLPDEELNLLRVKFCIFKVPEKLMNDKNMEDYKPQRVSFGPLHEPRQIILSTYIQGDPNVGPMERNKYYSFLHFVKKSQKDIKLYTDALYGEVDDLTDAYAEKWDSYGKIGYKDDFIQTMMRDGCFILQLLRVAEDYYQDEFKTNNPFFGSNMILNQLPLIKRDMLLVENQVPLRVLQILVNIQTGGDNTTISNDLIYRILNFFGLITNLITDEERTTCFHILDVYRRALVYEQSTKASYEGPFTPTDYTIPSATELQEAGIKLKRSETSVSLKGISFKDNTLYCPRIEIDYNTGSLFLNLMAFEALRIGTKKDVASYVYFMSSLMKSAADTRLLCELNIVHHKFRNDEDVVQLFSSKLKDFPLGPERWIIQVYSEVNMALKNPIRKRINAWKFDLLKNYLKSPWAVVSVIAAIILFTLTGVQTVYTVLSYDYQKGQGNSTHS